MVMRSKTLFTAILVVVLAAAACGSSEPETVTSAAPADESRPTTVEADAPDGLPDGDGEVSDSGESGASGSDDSDESGSLSDEDSGASSSSSSGSDESGDAASGDEDSGAGSSSGSDEADSGYSGEDSGGSSSSSSDDDAAAGGAGEDSETGSPDDTVSVTSDQIVGDGADISDPGPSNSGEPAPPRDQRELAYINDVAFQVLESWPMQVIVEVSGELPDPCHGLWWEVDVDGNTYDVQVWQVSPPLDAEIACAAVIEPFTENVPLGGGFVSDDYTVIVNGEPHSLNF